MIPFSTLATIASGAMGLFMTVISWRVLKKCPVLDNPFIHICAGASTFIGFRYRPDGLAGTICLGYEAVAVSILFLLLLSFGQRIAKRFDEKRQLWIRETGLDGEIVTRQTTHEESALTRNRNQTKHVWRRP